MQVPEDNKRWRKRSAEGDKRDEKAEQADS